MSKQTKLFYEFGPFRLNATERLLLRDGQPLPLTPKGLETLLLLVACRGQLLEKDELLNKVWADTIVEPANLTQTISVLRKLIEDDPQTPQYIQTIPKRGYRFIGEVRELCVEEKQFAIEEKATIAINHPEAHAVPAARRWLTRRLPGRRARLSTLTAFGLGGLGLSLLLAWRATLPPATPKLITRAPAPLVSARARAMSTLVGGRFSPDGRLVAFVADGEGQNVWVTQVNGSQPIQVTHEHWRDISPIWSPDGNRLAFVSNRGQQTGIWITPFLGGALELVKTLGDNSLDIAGGPPLLRAWAKDGQSIFYEWNQNLFRLNLASKQIVQLTQFTTQSPHHFALSPDEQWLAYVDQREGQFDVWKMQLSEGRPLPVTQDAARDRHPVWHPDGRRLIYSSVRDGRRQTYEIDAAGGEPTPLTVGDHDGAVADVSPGGDKILCYSQRYEADLYAIDLETSAERQLTGDLGVEFWPSVAPDGKSIAFQSIGGERFDWDPRQGALFIRNLNNDAPPRRLVENGFAARWSPAGDRLAFLRWTGQSYGLWWVPAAGGAERPVAAAGVTYPGQTGWPTYSRLQSAEYSWSPDGAQMAYGAKQDGIANIWVSSLPGGQAQRISANQNPKARVHCPLWSSGGDQLAFVFESEMPAPPQKQSWTLWRWRNGQAEIVFQTDSILRLLGWVAEGEVVFALAANEELNRATPTSVEVVTLSLTNSAARRVQHLSTTYLASAQLSADRRNLSFISTQRGRENIWVLSLPDGAPRQITHNVDEKLHYSGLDWTPDGKTICFGKQVKWNLLYLLENL